MKDELEALQKNDTWSLVARPLGKNVVGNKWIYKIKRWADGTLECYKAQLVAQGLTQHEGIDYDETFSPVVKPPTICTLLALAHSRS